MKTLMRALLVVLCLCSSVTVADVEVFPLRAITPDEAVESLRAVLGDRATVDVVQQKLVVVGDARALQDAATLLRKIDRLPANLRLTLTENPPTESQDPQTGMLVYTTDKNSQVVDTLEGALLTIDHTKFHQTLTSDGWLFSVDNQPVAVQQLQMRVRVVGARTAEVMMTFVRYENQQRRVYGRVVLGDMGTWIALLPQRPQPDAGVSTTTYSSGEKPGEQLYLKIEKVLVPTKMPQTR